MDDSFRGPEYLSDVGTCSIDLPKVVSFRPPKWEADGDSDGGGLTTGWIT